MTLSSGILMFRWKEKFSVFRNFFDQWNFFVEDCTWLHCSALESTNIFVQLSLDITFHAIKCGVTYPGYGESCHRWPSRIKWSLTPIVLRLKEIRYCSSVASGSLKTLAYRSLPKYWMQKNTKILKQNVWQLAPVYPTQKFEIREFNQHTWKFFVRSEWTERNIL